MPDLTWRRIDAPGGGLQAYYRGKWRLVVFRCSVTRQWAWIARRLRRDGAWLREAEGLTRRQRDAKHMARCALEMMEGEG